MKQKPIIAPSILAANFAKLGEECQNVINAGAEFIHFDVMDNHFVPNLSFGADICTSLKKYGINKPIDVHLMVENVDSMIERFIEAKADIITFHPETSKHINRSIKLIKNKNIKAGIVLNPTTPLNILDWIIDEIDIIVVMSVNPGFGGQKLIENIYKKGHQIRDVIDKNNLNIRLEVDGGVNLDNIKKLSESGFDTFVAGSSIFKSKDYYKTIQEMLNSIES